MEAQTQGGSPGPRRWLSAVFVFGAASPQGGGRVQAPAGGPGPGEWVLTRECPKPTSARVARGRVGWGYLLHTRVLRLRVPGACWGPAVPGAWVSGVRRGWCRALGAVAALTPTPTPPADCLLMLAYKDKSERAKGLRERSSLTLEDICGLEPGLPYEGLAHTLAIVCLSQAVMLGFDSREAMCAWDARIRYALGEGECAQSPRGRVLPALRGPRGSHRWAAEAGSRLPVPAERPLVSRDWGDGGFTGEMPLELPNLATSI